MYDPKWRERSPRPWGDIDLNRTIVYSWVATAFTGVAGVSIGVLTGFANIYSFVIAIIAALIAYLLGAAFRIWRDLWVDGPNWALILLATTLAATLLALGRTRDVLWYEGASIIWYGAMLGLIIVSTTSFLDYAIPGIIGAATGQVASMFVPSPGLDTPSTFSLAVSFAVGIVISTYILRAGPGGMSGSGYGDIGLLGFVWGFLSFSELGASLSYLNLPFAVLLTTLLIFRVMIALYKYSYIRRN